MKNKTALQNILLSHKKKQVDIAEQMGITPQSLYWLAKNPKKLRWEQIEALADVLGKSVHFITKHLN